MAAQIKFGTDGWRGIIADDFTFENVRRVGNAIATYVHKHEDAGKGLVVGYDTRFASQRAAEIVSEVLASSGIAVRLSNDYTPTPALSYAVKNLGAAGGVMITSSHNPYNWNGVKYKAGCGGSATPAIITSILDSLCTPRIYRPGGQCQSSRLQDTVRRRGEEVCRSRRDQAGRIQVRRRCHVRLGPRSVEPHLH